MASMFAAIDVGSNTLRLLIGSVEGNEVLRIYADRAITRLAEGVRETGRLKEPNSERSLLVLKNFTRAMEGYRIRDVKAVGTSALREAENSDDFLAAAYEKSGIRIEIISGTREARLTETGVLAGGREIAGADGPALVIDIGGGSTEWILHNGAAEHDTCLYGTLPIGVVTLLEKFIRKDPPSGVSIAALNRTVTAWLEPLKHEIAENALPCRKLIGTGGTITTLAAIDLGLNDYDPARVHGHFIARERLSHLRTALLSVPIHERQGIYGLDPGRADLIIPGVLLTMKVVEQFGFDGIIASDFGLLEGLIKESYDEKSF